MKSMELAIGVKVPKANIVSYKKQEKEIIKNIEYGKCLFIVAHSH